MPKILPLLCAAVFSVTAAASAYQGRFERKFQVNGPAQLEIDAGSSDITVNRGPAGTVSLIGKIHVNNRWLMGSRTARVQEIENNPPVRQDGNTIRIENGNLNNISIDYEITVPADTRVHSRDGSGDLKIQDLTADIDLQSGSGDVWLENIKGHMFKAIAAPVTCGPGEFQGRSPPLRVAATSASKKRVKAMSRFVPIPAISTPKA